MGLLSWLFPSDEDKLARARKDLEAGRHNDARLAALDLEGPEAAEIVELAEATLCRLNLEHAVSWAEAGDAERVAHHMELAEQFRRDGVEPDFADARERIRGVAATREAEARAEAMQEARMLDQINPGFHDGREQPEIPLPEGATEAEAEALKARLAILLDSYPEELQDSMLELGPDFAQAVLHLDDGEAEQALQILIGLPDDQPLVLHERARAAHALGDPGAATRAWSAFASLVGHHPIGNHHTAVLLAQVQAETGDLQGAIATLDEGRKGDPHLGGGLYASLQEATGDLGGAESTWRGLLKKYGAQPAIYVGIARVRVKGGHRMEAMQALETSLSQNDCAPGKCGYRPPDLATHRMLATLYLEDGIEDERAMELAGKAMELVQQPSWDDLYLAALVAKQEGRAELQQMVGQLTQATPDGDPRRELLSRHLAVA